MIFPITWEGKLLSAVCASTHPHYYKKNSFKTPQYTSDVYTFLVQSTRCAYTSCVFWGMLKYTITVTYYEIKRKIKFRTRLERGPSEYEANTLHTRLLSLRKSMTELLKHCCQHGSMI